MGMPKTETGIALMRLPTTGRRTHIYPSSKTIRIMKKKYLFSLLLLLFPLTATPAQAQDTTEVENPDEYI